MGTRYAWVFVFGVCLFSFTTSSGVATAKEACWIGPLYPDRHAEFDPKRIWDITTVNQAPSILGDLKNHFVLAYHSGSPQSHDKRVIAYSPKSPFIVAYTGCPPLQKGEVRTANPECEQLETMELQYPSESLRLTGYRLPGSKHAYLPLKQVRQDEEDPVAGTRCTTCHGDDPQARWEPYNTWPGFFGSVSREGEDVMREGSKEDLEYESFTALLRADLNLPKGAPTQYGRYTGLTWRWSDPRPPQEHQSGAPVSNHTSIGEIPKRILHSASTHPNAELGVHLSEWRGRRILRHLVTHKQFPAIRKALTAIALDCTEQSTDADPIHVTRYLPKALRFQNWVSFEKEIDVADEKALQLTREEIQENNRFSTGNRDFRYRMVGSRGGKPDRVVYQLAYLWKAIGGDFRMWNLSTRQKFNFNDGRGSSGPVMKYLLEYNQTCDPLMDVYTSKLGYEDQTGADTSQIAEDERRELCRSLESAEPN